MDIFLLPRLRWLAPYDVKVRISGVKCERDDGSMEAGQIR